MNAQWEQYNGEKEAIVKRLEESLKERQLEIEHLKRQISSNNRNTITFSPAQQVGLERLCNCISMYNFSPLFARDD